MDFQYNLRHFFEFYPFYPILGIFAKYGFFAKNYIIIRNIILGHFQPKLKTQFTSKVQKLHFWAILCHFFYFYPFYPILGIFTKYGFFVKNYITIRNIILGHFQPKLMTQFSSKVQKPHVWAHLQNIVFFGKMI